MKTKFLAVIVAFVFASCGGSSSEPSYPSPGGYSNTGGSNVNFGSRSSNHTDVEFRRTSYGCDECGCTGYWGKYHYLSHKYEGPCQNSDGYGHRCNHTPKEHGLPEY